MTNATFATALCALQSTIVGVNIQAVNTAAYFVLPDCYWALSALWTSFKAQNIIIQGSNATLGQVDPLLRFSALTTALHLENVRLIHPNTTYSGNHYPYTPNWTSLFAHMPLLTELKLTNSSLKGALPAALPALMNTFNVTRNSLSGAVPALFSNASSLLTSITCDLSHNLLTGVIPNLLSTVSGLNLGVTVNLGSNQLTGTIPPTFLNVTLANLASVVVSFANNSLNGPIPSALFPKVQQTLSRLQFDCSNNSLEGAIPTELFSNVVNNVSNIVHLALNCSRNKLTGSVPAWWPVLQLGVQLGDISLDLSQNKLSGSLPESLSPPAIQNGLTNFKTALWNLSCNALSGTIASNIIGTTSAPIKNIYAYLRNNSFVGSLPAVLASNGAMEIVNLDLASNGLTGTISTGFISQLGNTVTDLAMDISNNKLTGSIPDAFLAPFTTEALNAGSLVLNLTKNQLTGSIPQNIRGAVDKVAVFLDNNKLNGTFPSSDLFTTASTADPSQLSFDFSAAGNQIGGSIAIPSLPSPYPVSLNLSANKLTGLSVAADAAYLTSVDVSGNTQMTGTVPSVWLTAGSQLLTLSAARTSIGGNFPDLSGIVNIPLQKLDLSNTPIAFCNGTRSAWTAQKMSSCNLQQTSAHNCADSYPAVCQTRFSAPSAASSIRVSMPLLFAVALILLSIALFK